METKIAIIGIIVEDVKSVEQLNAVLHEHSEHIIGRMGLPYQGRKINIISIAIDAQESVISALCEKINTLRGVTASVAYGKCSA